MKIDLMLEMRSDWHVGSGGGRHGSIDRLLDRDADKLPYVPGSTLRGIWRDAAERLALGLDDGNEKGPWAAFVDDLFGSQPSLQSETSTPPRPGRLRLDDMRLPAALRAHITENHWLKEALTFAKPGVAIDPASGRAKDDHLRFEEMGRTGAVLTGAAHLDLPDDMAATACAFLAAAAKFVERLGGKRRRGAGKCALSVNFEGVDIDFKLLDADEPGIETTRQPTTAALDLTSFEPEKAAGNGWVEIPLTTHIETPVIVPDQVMGNVVTGLDFIPGTFLLGHVAKAFNRDFWHHVAAGDIQVSSLYPMAGDSPGLPAPACFERRKKPEGEDKNISLRNAFLKEQGGAEQYKPVREGYVAPEKRLYLSRPKKVVRTHNTVEDDAQKPTEDVGGVYSYEAIAPGQVYAGSIRLRAGLAGQLRRDALSGAVRLGRATRMGYGRARIEAGAQQEPVPAASQTNDGCLWIWCLSDLLLPGDALGGAASSEAVAKAVSKALGVSSCEVKNAAIKTRRIESWQAGWGLPRPTLVTIAAGSVIRLKPEGDVDATQLSALQAAGLGERRGEGYGRIAINHALIREKMLEVKEAGDEGEKASAEKAVSGDGGMNEEATEFLQGIERIAWTRYVREMAEAAGADEQVRKEVLGWKARSSKPVSSQLGGLRTMLGMVENGNFGPVVEWLDAIIEKDKAGKWGGKDAIEELKKLLENPDEVWKILEKSDSGDRPGEKLPEPIKKELQPRAVKEFLLHAIHYHRRAMEEGNKAQGTKEAAA